MPLWYRTWSHLVNVGYWSTRFWRLPLALDEKHYFPRNLVKIEAYMQTFTYKHDKLFGFKTDWMPWVITALDRDYDDCDGAAVLWEWALDRINIAGKLVGLKSATGSSGHMVYVSNKQLARDRVFRYVGTNKDLVKIDSKSYPQSLYDLWPSHDYKLM